jgi:hypothetical protein
MTCPTFRLRALIAAVCLASIAGAVIAFQAAQPEPASPGSRQPSPPPQPGQPGERGRPGGPGAEGRPISIEGAMKTMNGSLRRLRGQIADPAKKVENLRLINDMQRGCVMAKGQPLPPDRVEDAKDDAAKAKLNETFRRDLMAAMRTLLDIEQDLMDGKADSAKARLEEVIKARDAAHKEFGVKEDE